MVEDMKLYITYILEYGVQSRIAVYLVDWMILNNITSTN